MIGSAAHLLEFLEGSRKRFIIPVYQRNYDWKKDNCKQLFDDLVNLIKEDKETHFFGSIVSCAHRRDEIILIDGQQRVTTVSLILIAIINAIKNGACVPEEAELRERIEETYIIDKYRKGERKVRLKPFRDDCDAFDRLIFKTEEDYMKQSKVTINYQYFYDRITQERELSVDDLFRAVESLEIIDIQLEPEHGDDPQLIFESLNSTGLDLTESDKIRNFILMGLNADMQEQYYDMYWNKIEKNCGNELDLFVRNFLTIEKGFIPNMKEIYSSFKNYAKSQGNIENVLQSMLKYSHAYKDIVTYDLGSERANVIAKRLNLLEMTVAYPFLMAFVEYAKSNQLPLSEIEKVFSCVEIFIFRRLMCDLPTNALAKIFAILHRSVLKNKKEDDTYSSVMIFILENRKETKDFPKDEEFINGFVSKNIYQMKSKNKEYLFERLENGSSKETNDVIANIENGTYTIEHIMPQTLSTEWKKFLGENFETIQEKWLHTISNLTLTGYNSNYSNKSFEEKRNMKDGFQDSGLRLNQYIAKFNKWTVEELEIRKDHLSKLALSIWAYPKTEFKIQQKEEDIIELSEDNDVAVGRKIIYFTFKGTRYDVSTWADMMRDVAQLLYNIDASLLYNEASDKDNVWFSTEPISEKYEKISEGLYFCAAASSTWNKLSILKNLFKKYHLSEDELSFGVYPNSNDTKDVECIDGNTIWLIPANEGYFRLDDWFKTHDSIYWSQALNFKKGDKVYFYKTRPQMCINFLAEVEEVNLIQYDASEESKYYVQKEDFQNLDCTFAKFKLISKTENAKSLTLDILKEHGLSAAPQKGIILRDELLHYINLTF